jgi:hypothetical protein
MLPSGQGVFLLPSATNPQFAATFLAAVKAVSNPAPAAVESIADESLSAASTDEEGDESCDGSTDGSIVSSVSSLGSASAKHFDVAVGPCAAREEDLWDKVVEEDDAWSDSDDWSVSSDLTSLSASSASFTDSFTAASFGASSTVSWASFHDCLTRPSIPGLGLSPSASLFELDPLPELAANDEAFDADALAALNLAIDALTAEATAEAAADEEPAKTSKKEERRKAKAADAEAKAAAEKEARRLTHEKRARRNAAKADRRCGRQQLKASEDSMGEVEAALLALGLVR